MKWRHIDKEIWKSKTHCRKTWIGLITGRRRMHEISLIRHPKNKKWWHLSYEILKALPIKREDKSTFNSLVPECTEWIHFFKWLWKSDMESGRLFWPGDPMTRLTSDPVIRRWSGSMSNSSLILSLRIIVSNASIIKSTEVSNWLITMNQ